MELTLKRDILANGYTLGALSVDGKAYCYTVEDTVRELVDKNHDKDFDDAGEGKVAGKTAVPYGRYKVIVNMSNRFKKMMPLLIDVPGFSGVRIHSGNTAEDTEGCIIVGRVRTEKGVRDSREVAQQLTELLKAQPVVYITII
jgi:hypothetical protein